MDQPTTAAALTRAAPALSRPLVSALRSDAPFYLFIAAYACVVSLVASGVGAQRKMLPLSIYLGALLVLLSALALQALLTSLVAACAPSRLPAWQALSETSLLPGVPLFVAVVLFTCIFSSAKQTLPHVIPFYADPMLADLDAWIHRGDPWRMTNTVIPLSAVPLLEWVYLKGWAAVKVGCVLAALFLPRLRHLRARFVWTFLLIWTVLGNVAAAALMSGGPVFYDEVTGDAARFSDLAHFLNDHTNQQWVQDLVWRSNFGQGTVGSGVSAFPSLHVACATLCALMAWHAGRWARWAGIAFVGVILFGSVYLGWHYAVDGYFSILATVAIWTAVGFLERWQSARSQPVTELGSLPRAPARSALPLPAAARRPR